MYVRRDLFVHFERHIASCGVLRIFGWQRDSPEPSESGCEADLKVVKVCRIHTKGLGADHDFIRCLFTPSHSHW